MIAFSIPQAKNEWNAKSATRICHPALSAQLYADTETAGDKRNGFASSANILCSGAGCDVRQPTARVGKFTCEKCLYPPCKECNTAPRPRSTKYTVQKMLEWVCQACKLQRLDTGTL